MMVNATSSQSTGLTIRLTEPCVFLRGGDASHQRSERRRRRRRIEEESRSASRTPAPTPGPSQTPALPSNLRGGGGLSSHHSPSRTSGRERSGSGAIPAPSAGRLAVEGVLEGIRGRSRQRNSVDGTAARQHGTGQGSGGSGSRGRREDRIPLSVRGGAGGAARERSRGRTPTRAPSAGTALMDSTVSPPRPVVTRRVTDPSSTDATNAQGINDGAGDSDAEENTDDTPPPAILRGLLHLHLSRPSRIRKISLRLKGMAKTDWPEGIGTRRLEVMEEHELISLGVIYFDASAPQPPPPQPSAEEVTMRRAASLGPNPLGEERRGRSDSVTPMPLSSPVVQANTHANGTEGRGRAPARAFSVQLSPRPPGSENWGSDGVPPAHMRREQSPRRGSVRMPSDVSVLTQSSVPTIGKDGANDADAETEGRTRLRDSTVSDGSGAASTIDEAPNGAASAPVPGTARSSLERGLPSGTRPTFQPTNSMSSNPSRPDPPPPEGDPPPFQAVVGSSSLPRLERNPPSAHSVLVDEASQRSGSKTRFSLQGLMKHRDHAQAPPVRREESPSRAARSKSRGRATGLKAIKDALAGLSHVDDGSSEDEKHSSTGWREFKAGTYTYPISLPIPTTLPPTLHCDFGSVVYRLKATVVRAGALTANLHAETEVQMVTVPGEDDTEETESIVVQREWGTQLSYTVALSGKRFPIGGQIPVTIRLSPLSKMKVYRVSAFLEEKIDYFAHGRKITRHEGMKTFPLIRIEYPEPDTPLLPLLSDDPEAVQRSPLSTFWINPTSSDDTTPACLDPLGPWDLEGALQLPDCSTKIHFSCTHGKAQIAIKHWIKIIMRVERGDDEFLDTKGKRKRWDIIIESPVNILSCRCTSNMLPAYSYYAPSSSDRTIGADTCLCAASADGSKHTHGHGHSGGFAPGSLFLQAQPQLTSRPRASSPRSRVGRQASDSQRENMVLDVVADASPSASAGDEGNDPIGNSRRLARLLAGAQAEGGEPPPAYTAADPPALNGANAREVSEPSWSGRGRSPTRGRVVNGLSGGRGGSNRSGSGSGSSVSGSTTRSGGHPS